MIFAKAIKKLGYEVTRQTGSHLRLTTFESGQHHVTVPRHTPLRVGTLASILDSIATHFASAATSYWKQLKSDKSKQEF